MSPAAVVAYYLLVMAVLVLPRWKTSLGLAAAGLLLWTGTAAAGRWAAPTVRVLLLRLPPAHPAVVSFADGRVWLIDPGTQISAVLKVLRSRDIPKIDRLVLTSALPHRAWARLRQGIALHEAVRVRAPWRLYEKRVCFEFGGREGPRVLRGEAQYSIIPGRLKLGAVEVVTDGDRAGIR